MLKNIFALTLSFLPFMLLAQQPPNWTAKQLMEPVALAKILGKKEQPAVISIGPGAPIPYSTAVGSPEEKPAMDRLKNELLKLKKEDAVVIYCGCCPFAQCPNVRPAIALLKQMKFTNYYLLNLPQNIRVDWINKGYPVRK